ncbi:MucB/RseB C-terminal domain-containing protein [Marinobacter sp. chi1]|uniref:MucB/RseB C-terminal domain-containing protein n=1 Tax=Marinobacter suaedae TaxID=3057675 RepID=A0ABT8W3Z3_9GAMM|nr:MucB/RseB C-terminal domain-containing protein [Marinobacter sp. chi1]MDO3722955.1 MucB/RseB C-terminal domain-containing protein [Marinobacter sp. chi1]
MEQQADTDGHPTGNAYIRWPLLTLLFFLILPLRAEELTADQWLERLGPALNMTSYRGVFVYGRGSQMHSLQIAHRYRDGMVQERLVLQDGGGGEIVRKGMEVVCVLPRRGQVRLDQVIPSGPFAEAYAGTGVSMNRWYTAELAGEGRVAGYPVVVITLTAKDGHRYSHRLWLEKKTALLVKGQIGYPDGTVLEHFQFTSLEITNDIADEEFEILSKGQEVTIPLEGDSASAGELAASDGWSLDWFPDGFMVAATPRSGRGQAIAYSDGIAAFSVFVEPEGDVQMPTGVSRIGATTVYMRALEISGGRYQVTVVGEIPPDTARQVAESVRVEDALALNEVVDDN